VLEGLKSGNVAETCRKYEIAPNLYCHRKDEVEAGAKAALGGRSAALQPDAEQEKRIKQLERALGRSHLQIEILKNVSCGPAHSSARELVSPCHFRAINTELPRTSRVRCHLPRSKCMELH
jgi:hypothetical protein